MDAGQLRPPPGDRRAVRASVLRAGAGILLVGLAYGLVPVDTARRTTSVVAVVVGLVTLGVVVAVQVRRILRHPRPVLRAAEALAVVLPLFVVVFAWAYVSLSRAEPESFSEPLNRASSLYFTVVVLSTVGFGDIVPHTPLARLLVTAQIALDLTLLVVIVRLVVYAARAGRQRLRVNGSPDGDGAAEPDADG